MLNLLGIKRDRRIELSLLGDEVKTIVGQGDFLKGELVSNNFIRVDGDFLGTINSTKRVVVGDTGRVKSNINANEVVVSGIVLGNVHANNKIKVFQSGCIIGNISCRSIEVEEGAIIDGYMNIGVGSLNFPEKDVLIYTGSYKVDEDVLIEINKEMKCEDLIKTCMSEDDKSLFNDVRKIDED
ncbi:bactofilin family protein [Borrelia persica]|uniref:bactofilin family protein n=1 Tax=Borrelia persica TaxID=44448 RepID=UPI00046555BF|nr:polymer-forming cytoskeletal protein [Borrelia persica]